MNNITSPTVNKTSEMEEISQSKKICHNIALEIIEKLKTDKSEEVIMYEFNDKTSLAYYSIVATSMSNRHASALGERIFDEISKKYNIQAKINGANTGNWVLVDLDGVILHIFSPFYREAYSIEKMWYELGFVASREGELPEYFSKKNINLADVGELILKESADKDFYHDEKLYS